MRMRVNRCCTVFKYLKGCQVVNECFIWSQGIRLDLRRPRMSDCGVLVLYCKLWEAIEGFLSRMFCLGNLIW